MPATRPQAQLTTWLPVFSWLSGDAPVPASMLLKGWGAGVVRGKGGGGAVGVGGEGGWRRGEECQHLC